MEIVAKLVVTHLGGYSGDLDACFETTMAMPTAANSGLKALSRLRPLLDIFPLRDRISYCFAYGSGVFEQSLGKQTIASKNAATITDNNKQQQQQPMIDLVLAVDDAQQWHAANLDMNKSHYSGLRHLGAKWIGWIQEHFGAKIFYNTLVRLDDGRYIKYGVITTRDLVNDLLDWETLYISGRLHKPTLVLQQNTEDATLAEALKINHESALHAALLMLGRRFTEQELYLAIAGLSYAGDFRMTFGEDRNKVAKIVQPQVANFRDIYQPILEVSMANLVVATADGFEQNCERDATQWHLNLLPKVVQHHLW